MTYAALGAFERYSPADVLLHFGLMAWDAARRVRLLGHRLFELVEEVPATNGGFAGLMADHAALRTLAETFVFTVVVILHVSLVVVRSGRLRLLTGFLRRLGRVVFGVDDLTVEPEHGQFGPCPFLFLIQVVAADAVGREGLRSLVHFFFVEVTDEAFLVAWRALLEAIGELDAVDSNRLLVLVVAGGALEVVFLFELGFVFEQLFVNL